MSQQTLAPETHSSTHPVRTGARWVLQILLAALFIFSGVVKLIGDPEQVEGFEELGWGQWFRYFIGALELAGGIGLLIPVLAALAALGLAAIMVGAIFVHLADEAHAYFAVVPLACALLLAVVAWATRHRAPRSVQRYLPR
ncbi:DoxX family protein [Hoyosella rhizosphaerae]|uniref:DoxX family protein n=1 Tax=Hoyosella rhizosphaerae TaxID=1755582 RepID=A0A916X984_9ACTN|nr:DoxX family protein [Hoyosella rhizosphaerae]MBN4926808.1 DoxX family protein [Hoyosella rhizosphaerae]GGC56302.1 hypothetical protein GCM10011410_05960 [Hoyosella rhizosphaerae]